MAGRFVTINRLVTNLALPWVLWDCSHILSCTPLPHVWFSCWIVLPVLSQAKCALQARSTLVPADAMPPSDIPSPANLICASLPGMAGRRTLNTELTVLYTLYYSGSKVVFSILEVCSSSHKLMTECVSGLMEILYVAACKPAREHVQLDGDNVH